MQKILDHLLHHFLPFFLWILKKKRILLFTELCMQKSGRIPTPSQKVPITMFKLVKGGITVLKRGKQKKLFNRLTPKHNSMLIHQKMQRGTSPVFFAHFCPIREKLDIINVCNYVSKKESVISLFKKRKDYDYYIA